VTWRFPKYFDLVFNPEPNYRINSLPRVAPLAVTLDGFDNLVTLESNHRAALYFPGLTAVNAGSQLTRPLSPNMYVTMKPLGNSTFTDQSASFEELPNPYPLPTTLADTQVLIDDVPAPLQSVSPKQINFVVPKGARTSGSAEVQIVRPSTGQLLATGSVAMAVASPGFFTTSGDGRGQILATNGDGTMNSPSQPVARGESITLFGTGQGPVDNAPNDGEPAQGEIKTTSEVVVAIGTRTLEASQIVFSGLAQDKVATWQLTVKVPLETAPGAQVQVAARIGGFVSNQDSQGNRIVTTIAVKQ
jgi:uncharacterized protein (TIGR03437 family)